jgi:hypothetical protein
MGGKIICAEYGKNIKIILGHAKDNGWFYFIYFWLKGVIGDGPRKNKIKQ